jgi:hypothetical protein
MGFWVHVIEPRGVLFKYLGTQPVVNQSIPISLGWNMVGYPSHNSYDRTLGLNNLEFEMDIDAVQWYDSASKTWHIMGENDIFIPGNGYWVHSELDTTWDVAN